LRFPISASVTSLTVVLIAAHATAAEAPVSFQRDVRPILSKHCFECHAADTQESNLRVDRRADLLKGGKSGRAGVVPGRSADSRLLLVVSGKDKKLSMPPDGARLTAGEIEILRRWIDQGAAFDDGAASSGPSADFWSFKPVRVDRPPVTQDKDFPGNPLDAFIAAKLHSAGLAPSPSADRRTLIRRLYLDVLGLPPSPAEIAQFAADADPLAWNRLVDRVLASPHFGERWARHWLDVVRFAETDGFETNIERPNAYPYRDYLIGAFNADKPYDRLVFEQLAGDSVGADAATGFLVGGPCDKVKSPDPVLTRMQRQDELTDIINTTGTTFLGLTLGCAKCHNHKFDPIPQHDFYAVEAVFAGVQHGERPLDAVDEPRRLAHRQELIAEIERTTRALARLGLRPPVDPRRNTEVFEPVRARRVRFTIRATNDGTEPCLDELVILAAARGNSGVRTLENVALASAGATVSVSSVFPGSSFHKRAHLNDGRFGNERSWISNEHGKGWAIVEFPRDCLISQIEWGRDRSGVYRDRLPTDYLIEAQSADGRWKPIAGSDGRLPPGASALPLAVLPARLSSDERREASKRFAELQRLSNERENTSASPRVYAGLFEQPDPVHRLYRGDPGSPRDVVNPGAIAAVGPLEIPPAAPEQERRVALARWIARPQNPLTARVMVNRLWHYHFGRGIVETPSDFGHNGGRPSHLELLDWLANELVHSGWSLKHVHRLILTSATYRQLSAPRVDGLKVDASARLLWRFPPRRLEAEAIRDSMLTASGVLEERMGGPGFSPFQPNTNYVRVYRPKEQFGPSEWRRMVYMSKVRMEQDSVFGAFDCPDAGLIAPRRTQSTTAVQALGLFNSRFTEEQADLMAERCRHEAGSGAAPGVQRAFELAFGRQPDEVESRAAELLVARYGLPSLCRALFNANEFLFLP
jgi:Protein of unknown function (DUF1553)/Protein of unknown function (DUF1549)/Planctomycete cytochrome C